MSGSCDCKKPSCGSCGTPQALAEELKAITPAPLTAEEKKLFAILSENSDNLASTRPISADLLIGILNGHITRSAENQTGYSKMLKESLDAAPTATSAVHLDVPKELSPEEIHLKAVLEPSAPAGKPFCVQTILNQTERLSHPDWEPVVTPLVARLKQNVETVTHTNGLAEEDRLMGEVAHKVLTAIQAQMEWKLLEQIVSRMPVKEEVEAKLIQDKELARQYREDEQVDEARKTDAELIKYLEDALKIARNLLTQIADDRNKAVRTKLEQCREEALQLLKEGQELRDAMVERLKADLVLLAKKREDLRRMTNEQITTQEKEDLDFQNFCEEDKKQRGELEIQFNAVLKADLDRQARFKERMKQHIASKATFAVTIRECKNLDAHIDQRERVVQRRQQVEENRAKAREDIRFLILTALNGTLDHHERAMKNLAENEMRIKQYYIVSHSGYYKQLSIANYRGGLALKGSEDELKTIRSQIKRASAADDSRKVAKLKVELAEAQADMDRRAAEIKTNTEKLETEEKFASQTYEELKQPHPRQDVDATIRALERSHLESAIEDLEKQSPSEELKDLRRRLSVHMTIAAEPELDRGHGDRGGGAAAAAASSGGLLVHGASRSNRAAASSSGPSSSSLDGQIFKNQEK